MNRFRCLIVLACVALAGCGKSDKVDLKLVSVSGTVSRKSKPLADADLIFIPIESTPGKGGTARSDGGGKFTVKYREGGDGLPAGKYRVTASRRLMPDGSPVPPDDTTEPMDSPARETLPRIYTNGEESPLTVTVAEGTPLEIKIDR